MNAVDLAQDSMKIGFIGTYGNRAANILINKCDLLVAVGARLGLRQVGRLPNTFAPKAQIIRVDIDENELSRNVNEKEIKCHMDVKSFLKEALSEDIPKYTDWKNKCFKLKNILEDYDKDFGNLVMEKISDLLPKNALVAVDVGQNQCWAAQSLHLKGRDGRIFINGGYGSMGCALPVAIGVSISVQKNTVYCLTGDGGLQMNIQELETIVRENLPIKIVILNNKSLGKISEIQYKSYNSRYIQTNTNSGYSVPNFEKIANAYGIKSATLTSYEDLDKYEEYFLDAEPCLLDVHLPDDTLLTPKIDWKSMRILPELDNDTKNRINNIFNAD